MSLDYDIIWKKRLDLTISGIKAKSLRDGPFYGRGGGVGAKYKKNIRAREN